LIHLMKTAAASAEFRFEEEEEGLAKRSISSLNEAKEEESPSSSSKGN